MTIDNRDEHRIVAGINTLQREVHQTAVAHGWWEEGGEGQSFGEKVALMHSELSEALESHRNGEPDLWYKHASGKGHANESADDDGELGKPEGAAAEFADTIIRIMDYCERHGIPLAEALVRKAAYNETRPYKHGGKRI